MTCLFAISLYVLVALTLTSDAASIHDKTAIASTTRTSEDAITLTTSTSQGSTSGSLVADELNRAKRTLGIDKNVNKNYEIKTKHGTTIKFSKSITYNDGGGLTMLPALIDSIGANRRKLIYALRGHKYCNGCVSGVSSNENNELAGDDNVDGNIDELSASAQAGGPIGELGGVNAEAAAEASGQAQIIGSFEGCGSSCWGSTAGSSSQASAQSSTQVSSQAESISAVASSEASAQASSQAQAAGGSSQATAQAVAEASNQAGGTGGCEIGGCAGGIIGDSSQASAQAAAQGSSQIGVSGGCEGYGCESGIAGTSNQVPVPEIAQGGRWEAGSQVVVGGSGIIGWEGAHTVGGWPDICAGDYIGYGSNCCICSHMMPVLLAPAYSYEKFRSRHSLHNSPFSHIIRRHIGRHIGSKMRPRLSIHYPSKSLCSPYNPCRPTYGR